MAIFKFLRKLFGSVYSTIPFALWLGVLFSANIPFIQELSGIESHHIMAFIAVSALFYVYVQLSALNDYTKKAAHVVGNPGDANADREGARALLRKDIRLSRLPMIVILGFALFWGITFVVPEFYDRLPSLPPQVQFLSDWCDLHITTLKAEIALVYFFCVLVDMRFATKTDCLFEHIIKGQIEAAHHANPAHISSVVVKQKEDS